MKTAFEGRLVPGLSSPSPFSFARFSIHPGIERWAYDIGVKMTSALLTRSRHAIDEPSTSTRPLAGPREAQGKSSTACPPPRRK
jgi:hypothetical protein